MSVDMVDGKAYRWANRRIEELEAENKRLADLGREQHSALDRLLTNAERIFDEYPVRDWRETLDEARAALARYEREVTPRMARDEMDEKRERDQRESDCRTEDEMRRQERVDER